MSDLLYTPDDHSASCQPSPCLCLISNPLANGMTSETSEKKSNNARQGRSFVQIKKNNISLRRQQWVRSCSASGKDGEG